VLSFLDADHIGVQKIAAVHFVFLNTCTALEMVRFVLSLESPGAVIHSECEFRGLSVIFFS
jgi:hypothetical protein